MIFSVISHFAALFPLSTATVAATSYNEGGIFRGSSLSSTTDIDVLQTTVNDSRRSQGTTDRMLYCK